MSREKQIITIGVLLLAVGLIFLLGSQKPAAPKLPYREFEQNCQMEYITSKSSYPLISELVMAKNESHFAYIATSTGSARVIYDGVPQKSYRDVYGLVLSEDGKHFLYRAVDGAGGWTIIKDKTAIAKRNVLSVSNLAISSFGTHTAYVVDDYSKEKNTTKSTAEYVVYDGKEKKSYFQIQQLTFSPDEQHFAYRAKKANDKWVVVIDGKESKEYDQISTLLFREKENGFLYQGIQNNQAFIVWGAKIITDQEEMRKIDIEQTPYKIERDGKWVVVKNGRESQPYNQVLFINSFANSPFYFIAQKKTELMRVYCPKS